MASVLSTLSEELATTVSHASQGVVRLEARRRLPASGVVWSADGVIVTAHHVVERKESIRVGLPDGSDVEATLVGRDPATDLAVLSANAKGLTPARWNEADDLRVGHLVLALGRPGQTVQATLGIVSALGGSWVTPARGRLGRYLQTDVVMYPGFSGGPLVDAGGTFLGLNTSAILRGITVTVPSVTVRQVVETLMAHGRMRRGYLGVGAQPVRLPPALAQELGLETGLLLVSVAPESPAERDGMLLGDIIVALDGQPVRHIDDLQALLDGTPIGTPVKTRVVRGGKVQELTVSTGERSRPGRSACQPCCDD